MDPVAKQNLGDYINHLQSGPAAELGNGVFKYWRCLSDDGGKIANFNTLWLLVFYESTAFLGITVGSDPKNS